jgi:hypothetical protein
MNLVKKFEVNLEKENERVDRRETVSETHQPNSSGKKESEGVNSLIILATKSDL